MSIEKTIEECVNFEELDNFIQMDNNLVAESGADNKTPVDFEVAKAEAIDFILNNTDITKEEWVKVKEATDIIRLALDSFAIARSNSALEDFDMDVNEVLH